MNNDNMQWDSYSKLVLAELARLNQNITYLMEELQSLKRDMTEIKVKEDAVKEAFSMVTKTSSAEEDY